MRFLHRTFCRLALCAATISVGQAAPDQMEKPPAGWSGPVFEANFAFPTALPADTATPWETINYTTQPDAYLTAVLSYVLEGQDKSTWLLKNNTVRQWYHMPWMGPGASGREFIHGLTRERSSRKLELGPKQTKCRQNWAIGFLNDSGGYTLGQIWGPTENGLEPNLKALPFPTGTVVAKLLFTQADANEVELLTGAPTVDANIHAFDPASEDCPNPTENGQPTPRSAARLSLLQLDIAVRDPRADEFTGWVFGTFVYDGTLPGDDPWAKLRPVGLMWGNDFALSDTDAAKGEKPKESIVLNKFGFSRDFGRGGRMNGPVDNKVSACLSCHATAQWPNPAPLNPPSGMVWSALPNPQKTESDIELARASCWFRNLKPNEPFGLAPSDQAKCETMPSAGSPVSLDYSLQLAVALRNWHTLHPTKAVAAAIDEDKNKQLSEPTGEEVLDIGGVESLPVHRGGDEQ